MAKNEVLKKYGRIVDKAKKIVQCRRCENRYNCQNGFSHLRRHFVSKHGEEEKNEVPSSRNIDDSNVSKKAPYSNLLDKSKKRMKLLCQFIASASVPLSIVDNKYFREYIKEINSDVSLPSRQSIRRNMKSMAEELLHVVKQYKDEVSITTDGWSMDNAQYHLQSLTVHAITNDYERINVVGGAGLFSNDVSCDANNTISLLEKMFSRVGLNSERIIAATTDNASVMKAVCSKMTIPRISCFAHNLHLVVAKFLEIDDIAYLLQKTKEAAKLCNKSALHRKHWLHLCKQFDLSCETPKNFSITRWGGAFLLFKTFVDHKIMIEILTEKRLKFPMFTPDDILLAQFVVDALDVFYSAQLAICAEDSTVCMYLPVARAISLRLAKLKTSLEEEGTCESFLEHLTVLIELFEERFCPMFEDENLIVASIIDPRYSFSNGMSVEYWRSATRLLIARLEEEDAVKQSKVVTEETINAEDEDNIEEVAAKKPKFDLWADYSTVSSCIVVDSTRSRFEVEVSELEKTIKNVRNMTDDIDPLCFWKSHCANYPNVAHQARRLLSVPPSSVESERLFSTCGYISSNPRRNRMLPSTLEDILIVSSSSKYEKLREINDPDEETESEDEDETA